MKLTVPRRQNPAVAAKADKAFTSVVQALEAETLQGNVAARVVSSVKQLVAATGLNVEPIFAAVRPENQMKVREFFQ